jgi:hypothetical protein
MSQLLKRVAEVEKYFGVSQERVFYVAVPSMAEDADAEGEALEVCAQAGVALTKMDTLVIHRCGPSCVRQLSPPLSRVSL